MLDILVCTNWVNYTVCVQGILRHPPARATWLLYDAVRIQPDPAQHPGCKVLRLSLWLMRLLKLLSILGRIHTVYLPHHMLNKRLLWVARRASVQAYLDDGLDTHRAVPRNLQPATLSTGTAYFTFQEFDKVPGWMTSLELHRVCSMRTLATRPSQEPLDVQGVRHVFFEAPGLDVGALIDALHLNLDEVLVVQHPVHAKAGVVPTGCRVVAGAQTNAEAALLQVRGLNLYFGETLLLYFAACFSRPGNKVFAQMSGGQWSNLVGLPRRLVSPAGQSLGLWELAPN